MRLVRVALVLCMAASLLAFAQQKPAAGGMKAGKPSASPPEKPGAKKSEKPAAIPMPKPSPEIQKLAKMWIGTYTTKEAHEPGPFMPNGGTGAGEARFILGPGGNSIIENYRSKSSTGASYRGHGVTWYDTKAGVYRGLWCDNMSPVCDAGGTSKWEGDKLVGGTEFEMMGKKLKMQYTVSDFSPTGFKYTAETSFDGGPMKRTMVIEYTRANAAPTAEATEKPEKK